MSLADRLTATPGKNKPGLPCRVGSLLLDSTLSDKDKEALQHQMVVSHDDPSRIPTTAIREALTEEGYAIGLAAIIKHRRRECRCFGPNSKFATMTQVLETKS